MFQASGECSRLVHLPKVLYRFGPPCGARFQRAAANFSSPSSSQNDTPGDCRLKPAAAGLKRAPQWINSPWQLSTSDMHDADSASRRQVVASFRAQLVENERHSLRPLFCLCPDMVWGKQMKNNCEHENSFWSERVDSFDNAVWGD